MMSKTILLFLQVIGVFAMVWASDEGPVVCGPVASPGDSYTKPCYVGGDGNGEPVVGMCVLLEKSDEDYTCVLASEVACKPSSPFHDAVTLYDIDEESGELMMNEEGQPQECVPGAADQCLGGSSAKSNICVTVDAHDPSGFCCSFDPLENP